MRIRQGDLAVLFFFFFPAQGALCMQYANKPGHVFFFFLVMVSLSACSLFIFFRECKLLVLRLPAQGLFSCARVQVGVQKHSIGQHACSPSLGPRARLVQEGPKKNPKNAATGVLRLIWSIDFTLTFPLVSFMVIRGFSRAPTLAHT